MPCGQDLGDRVGDRGVGDHVVRASPLPVRSSPGTERDESAALLDQFGRAPKAAMGELLTDPDFWRLQLRRMWDVTNLLPGTDPSPARHLWMLGLIPVAGLIMAGARWLARPAAGGLRLDAGRWVAVGLCAGLLGLLQLTQVQFVSGGGGGHVRYLFPGLVTIGLVAAAGLGGSTRRPTPRPGRGHAPDDGRGQPVAVVVLPQHQHFPTAIVAGRDTSRVPGRARTPDKHVVAPTVRRRRVGPAATLDRTARLDGPPEPQPEPDLAGM